MAIQGLLIDYNYCTGCMTCQLACQMEHGLADEENGLMIQQIGPFPTRDGKWEFDFVPVPTDFCDLCEERTQAGKQPTCVQHCQASCMSWGDLSDLAAQVETPKQAVFAVK